MTADQMSITPVSDLASAPAEIREQLEAAYEQIQNAASVAGILLTTESLVADKPEPPAPAAPAAPDMGGMY